MDIHDELAFALATPNRKVFGVGVGADCLVGGLSAVRADKPPLCRHYNRFRRIGQVVSLTFLARVSLFPLIYKIRILAGNP